MLLQNAKSVEYLVGERTEELLRWNGEQYAA